MADFGLEAGEVLSEFLLRRVDHPTVWIGLAFAAWDGNEANPVEVLPVGDWVGDNVLDDA